MSRLLLSEAEFLALPDSGQRMELMDGELILGLSPTFSHQNIAGRIYAALLGWASSAPFAVTAGIGPVDIRFGRYRILQPDVFLYLLELPLTSSMPLAEVPGLCVEVLSERRSYDRIVKRTVYAEAGVREYWVVDPMDAAECWSGAGLSTHTLMTDSISSQMLPGFALRLADLGMPLP